MAAMPEELRSKQVQSGGLWSGYDINTSKYPAWDAFSRGLLSGIPPDKQGISALSPELEYLKRWATIGYYLGIPLDILANLPASSPAAAGGNNALSVLLKNSNLNKK